MGKDFLPENDNKGLEVWFEYVQPSEAYYHIVRCFLVGYLDGVEQEKLNIS